MSEIRRILVGTDFGADADRAVTRAARLAAEHGATLEILHVLDRQALVETQSLRGIPRSFRRSVVADARARLEQLRSLCAGAPAVELSVRIGSPRAEILKAGAAVDLLVLGVRGASPIRDLLLGTTAERVLNTARAPILVVRCVSGGSYERVLAPVDFSVYSQRALEFATRVSAAASVSAVHAYVVPFEGYLRLGGSADEQIADFRVQERLKAEAQLQALLDAFPAERTRMRGVAVHGDPIPTILQMQEQMQAELIVMGKRGRSAVSDALIGSVTRRILANASCDVLVLPAGRK
jgi:nucleotide-binding universal stress UspA family protein